jgi:hypothetical protein
MIGDSYVDVQTARNAGVAACGVTYGFQPDSFQEFPPDVLVDRLEEFAAVFIEMSCLFCCGGACADRLARRGHSGVSRSSSLIPRACAADSPKALLLRLTAL